MKQQLSFLAKYMKRRKLHLLTLLLGFYSVMGFGQTFTNSTGQNLVGSPINATINVTVNIPSPSATTRLQQVNISFGDGSTQYNAEMNKMKFVLEDPSGNKITLLSNGNSFSDLATTSSNADLKFFHIHLRDNGNYKTVKETIGSSGATYASGYPFYYGYYRSETSFNALNTGSSVNGTWKLIVTGTTGTATTSSKTRRFNSIDLVFGEPLPAPIDIKGGNMSCADKKCIQTGNVYLATNNGYTNGQGNPATTVDGCYWNADNNNKSWFSFIASATTAELSFSGFSTQQQSVIVQASSTNDCLTTFTSVPSGGCMSEMIGASTTNKKYYKSGYSPGNGLRWNHGYSLTGLTVGQMYIFVIEGSENANSDFLIEIKSGADGAPAPSANDQAFCGSSTVANLAPSGLNWYTSSTGGSPLASGTALANNTDYYAEQGGACPSARKKIKVTLDANPTKPTSISATPTANWCHGTPITLTANGTLQGSSQYVWGTSSGGNQLGTTSVNTLNTTPTATTTYYVGVSANGSCPAQYLNTGTTITLPSKGNMLASDGNSQTCYVSGNSPIHFYSSTSPYGYIGSINPNGRSGTLTMTAYVNASGTA
ncbi:MAG TPA: hypothetical protein PLP27_03145, partial [Crocinitomicaceae bacterium]|nr:hypothetical protein [Crocinitomicaceae bacterium]